jgi:hypothetical protein
MKGNDEDAGVFIRQPFGLLSIGYFKIRQKPVNFFLCDHG